MTHVALSIAGSDPSGGGGIQADLKTFHQHRVYGTTVVTLLTVQNTTGLTRVDVLPPDLVLAQLDAVLEDLPPVAAKTGTLGNAGVIEAVASRAGDFRFPLVVDPVMISKHGTPLLDSDAVAVLRKSLLPRAFLVTPNVHEAQVLSGREVRDRASALDAAKAIADCGPRAVLVMGGYFGGAAVDVLLHGDSMWEFVADRIDAGQTQGTGCSLSAAITARLAAGQDLVRAARAAKRWLTRALRTAPGLGAGHGPVDHWAAVT